jgi:hypothetical protein
MTLKCIALLLSLAPGLKYLDLGQLNDWISRKILSTRWQNLVDINADYSLCKLKEVNTYDRSHGVLVLPSMTTVRAIEASGTCEDGIFRTPY